MSEHYFNGAIMADESSSDKDIIVRVAWLYYIKELNQQQIAQRLSISRPKVQRLLERSRNQQIIQFYVKQPSENIELKTDKAHYSNMDLISHIAWLYYIKQLNQQEIADKLQISRPKVQRLLEKARDQEIIQFFIKHPNYNLFEIEREIVHKFRIRDALIVPEVMHHNEEKGKSIAQAGAAYFEMSTRSLDQEIIGIGWGETVAQVIDHFISTTDVNVRPATLIGGLNGHSNLSPHLTTAKLAVEMNMEFSQILSPAIVESRETASILKKEPSIASAIETGEKAKLLLISLGNLDRSSSIVTNGVIDATTYSRLREKGAVGEILGHFFNDKGVFIEDEIDSRVVGVSKRVFENRHNTIICVAEASKKRAILAALHAGLIDVLISDEETAKYILPEHKEKIDIHRAEEELMGK